MRPNFEDCQIHAIDTDHYDLVQWKHDGRFTTVDIDGWDCFVKNRKGNVVKHIKLKKKHKRSVVTGEWMKGTQRSKASDLHFIVFDCVSANGWYIGSRTYLERMKEASSVEFPQEVEDVLGFVVFAESFSLDTVESLWGAVELGEMEGLILRRNNLPFGGTVARVKPLIEKDFYATQVHWNLGRPVSIGGSLEPGGEEVVRARLCVGAVYDKFQLGRCFVVRGQELTEKGSIRFPMFAGWHNDK